MKLMSEKLEQLRILPTSDLEMLVDGMICENMSNNCVYDTCSVWKGKPQPGLLPLEDNVGIEEVKCFQWGLKKVSRSDKSD